MGLRAISIRIHPCYNDITASRNLYGKGIVDWIPTPVELGNDIERLGRLYAGLSDGTEDILQIFSYNDSHVNTKIMETDKKVIYVVTNTDSRPKTLSIKNKAGKKLALMFGNASISSSALKIDAFGHALLTIDKAANGLE